MNKLKRSFSVLTTAAMIAGMMGILPVTAADQTPYGLTVKTVKDMDTFKSIITSNGDCCIRLEKDISVSQDTKSKSTDAYFNVGKGHKVIDLNGCDIKVSDDRTGEDFMHLTMFEVGEGANLEINDKDNKGEIFFNGYILAGSDYKLYSADINRDIFHVDGGELTINGGTVSGGRSKDEYVYSPYIYMEDGKFEGEAMTTDPTHYPRKNINATAIDMTDGKVTINGGHFYGRGIDHSWFSSDKDSGSSIYNFVRNGVVETKGGELTVNSGSFHAKSNSNVFDISDDTDVTIKACETYVHKNGEILIIARTVLRGSYGRPNIPDRAVDKKRTYINSDNSEDEPY